MNPLRLVALVIVLGIGAVHAAETTFLTYNVWFDDDSGLAQRYKDINAFIQQQQPDYVCLQEVTPVYLEILKRDFAGKYYFHEGLPRGQRYGNVTLSRVAASRSELVPLGGRLNRHALIVEGRDYTLVNLHLESMLDDTAIRERQLEEVLGRTSSAERLVLCGDFNFGDGERENRLLGSFVDAGREQPVATYDIMENRLAAQTRFYNEPSRRLDRIVVRGEETRGALKVFKYAYSDHYPVLLTLPVISK